MDVRAAISKAELGFTDTERKIATFILERGPEVASMVSSDVAKAVGVSQSSIIKFVKKLGFDGYVDFKLNLYESDERGRQVIAAAFGARGVSLEEPFPDVVGALYASSIEALRQTYENLDMRKVERAVAMLEGAERIYLCGKGTSFLAASDFSAKLMKFGFTVICMEDLDTMEVSALSARPGDLYVAFSFSGESQELVRILERARACGAKTLVITKSAVSTLAGQADLRLDIITDEQDFRAATMSSRIAFLSIVDMLFTGVLKNDLEVRLKKVITD